MFSALLFVLSVEIMASRLRNNKDIKGFQIKIDEKTRSIKKNKVFILSILFSQFNFSLFFIVTKIYTQCFNRYFIPFNALYFISGLLMNKNKTGGIWVGKLKHSKDKIEGIKWYEIPIKTLGIYFGNNKEE
jgi:hypothetical protein